MPEASTIGRLDLVDLDDFDEAAYFGSGKHCCAFALALQELTGWPMYVLWTPSEFWSHVVVKSPLGFLDAKGFNVGEWEFAEHMFKAHVEQSRQHTEGNVIHSELEEEEASSDLDLWGSDVVSKQFAEKLDSNSRSLELARPLARLVLEKYFPGAVFEKPAEQLDLFSEQ